MRTNDPFGAGKEWLNSGPRTLGDGVMLVNFWTLTCINWLRQEPWVRAWWRAYRGDGLVVVGVHTPEFGFEHDIELVRRAVRERQIDYPVVIDNEYGIWQSFDNHYWPALYFVDATGRITDSQFGEGRYDRSERILQRLLGVERDLLDVRGEGVEAEADWRHLRSPETYLGSHRAERQAAPERLRLNHWALRGGWASGSERVVLTEAGGSIVYRFEARDVHLVLAAGRPVPFRVSLDGGAPGAAHGLDVAEDGRGVVREGRLYQLVRQPGAVRERTLEITFEAAGAEAYAFTFG